VYYISIMSGYLRTAAKLAFGLWLTVAFALAPAAGMARHCLSGQASAHQSMSDGQKAQIHAPCKHCDGKQDQTPCKGHCAGLAVSIVPLTIAFAPMVQAARVIVHGTVAPGDFLRPPDTPPPRSFPV
jgi:hypothetical protein